MEVAGLLKSGTALPFCRTTLTLARVGGAPDALQLCEVGRAEPV
jgi:hypothetical protein